MTEPNSLFAFPQEKIRIDHVADSIFLLAMDSPVVLSSDEARAVASRLIEASAQVDGMDLDESDARRIPVQFLRFEVKKDSAVDSSSPGSAIVHCWIAAQTQTNARYIASGWIEEESWTITALLDQCSVTRESYADSDELQYYEQALIDGEVFLFEIYDGDPDNGPQE